MATEKDLVRIMEIYQQAKSYMAQEGNPTQWDEYYPSLEILREDIVQKELFVVEIDNLVHGVFAFILGEDETYQEISNGKWLNNLPYGTIHRIASSFSYPGIVTLALNDGLKKISNIKIDTHPNNQTMQAVILKNGFQYCGEIKAMDGSKRLAYQYYKEEK